MRIYGHCRSSHHSSLPVVGIYITPARHHVWDFYLLRWLASSDCWMCISTAGTWSNSWLLTLHDNDSARQKFETHNDWRLWSLSANAISVLQIIFVLVVVLIHDNVIVCMYVYVCMYVCIYLFILKTHRHLTHYDIDNVSKAYVLKDRQA